MLPPNVRLLEPVAEIEELCPFDKLIASHCPHRRANRLIRTGIRVSRPGWNFAGARETAITKLTDQLMYK